MYDDSLRIKNVILKDFNITKLPPGFEGLDIIHRKEQNNENYVSLTGQKQLINNYLQDKPILSERLRTLNDIPHFRIINTIRKEIY
jgi:hypothetical protein